MKQIEIKVIRVPSGKYLCKPAFGGLTQTSKLSQAMTWYQFTKSEVEQLKEVKTNEMW